MSLTNKVIFIDLDGTLLNSDKKISEKNINYLSFIGNKYNAKIVLTTGRHFHQIEEYISVLNLRNKENYVITADGQYLYSVNGDLIWSADFLSMKDVKFIMKSYKEINIYTDKFDIFITKDLYNLLKSKLISLVHSHNNRKKYTVYYSNMNRLEKNLKIEKLCVSNFIKEEYMCTKYHIVKNQNSIYIMHKNTNKYNAIRKYSDIFNINKEDIIFLGDDYNDYECFHNLENTVAMGNSIEEIKNIAKYITKSNNDDGVYWGLKMFE